MHPWRSLPSLLLAGVALAAAPAARVQVQGTELLVTLPDGRVLRGAGLVGMELQVTDEAGASRRVRIDGVSKDPEDPDGEVTLYTSSVRDPATGAWGAFCQPGPDGTSAAFPLSGTWTADMRHLPSETAFNLTCTSGAIGKCVRWGYKPWKDGATGWEAHQACVRMVRADYCGDGVATTRDGMRIDVYDLRGIQTPANEPDMAFEAGWGPDGALCVHHVRVPEHTSLDALLARCPSRLAGHTGAACSEAVVRADPALRVMNRSRP